jgi:hypothetical protein
LTDNTPPLVERDLPTIGIAAGGARNQEQLLRPIAPQTIDVLNASDNLAALDLWVEVLLTGPPDLQDLALERILTRRHREYMFRVVTVFDRLAERHRWRIITEGLHLSSAIRRAYLDPDSVVYQNACELICLLPDYDQAPLLLGSLTETGSRKDDAAAIFEHLISRLAEELELPVGRRSLHDVERIRDSFLDTLATGLRRYPQHKVDAIPLGILVLSDDSSQEVRNVARDTDHPGYSAILSVLRHHDHPRVLRWVYLLLGLPDPPVALLNIISARDDGPFLDYLLDQAAMIAEVPVQRSLRRVTQIGWLSPSHDYWTSATEARQAAGVVFCVHTGLPLDQRLAFLDFVLTSGSPAARRAAAAGLALIPGADANQMVLQCLEDRDPSVQLAAVQQLRKRQIPNAMGLLLPKLDSTDSRIAKAVRDEFAEYRFERYLGTFDRLSDPSRTQVGRAIFRIDPKSRTAMIEHLSAPERNHRIRAIRAIRTLRLVDEFLGEALELLDDEDRVVVREAMETLALATSVALIDHLNERAAKPSRGQSAAARETLEYLSQNARDAVVRTAALHAFLRFGAAG